MLRRSAQHFLYHLGVPSVARKLIVRARRLARHARIKAGQDRVRPRPLAATQRREPEREIVRSAIVRAEPRGVDVEHRERRTPLPRVGYAARSSTRYARLSASAP
jgi:hypothetical protein